MTVNEISDRSEEFKRSGEEERAEKRKKKQTVCRCRIPFGNSVWCNGVFGLAFTWPLLACALICGTEGCEENTGNKTKQQQNEENECGTPTVFSITYMLEHDLWRSIGSDQSKRAGPRTTLLIFSSSGIRTWWKYFSKSILMATNSITAFNRGSKLAGTCERSHSSDGGVQDFRVHRVKWPKQLEPYYFYLLVIQLAFNLISSRIPFLFRCRECAQHEIRTFQRISRNTFENINFTLTAAVHGKRINLPICTWQTFSETNIARN